MGLSPTPMLIPAMHYLSRPKPAGGRARILSRWAPALLLRKPVILGVYAGLSSPAANWPISGWLLIIKDAEGHLVFADDNTSTVGSAISIFSRAAHQRD